MTYAAGCLKPARRRKTKAPLDQRGQPVGKNQALSDTGILASQSLSPKMPSMASRCSTNGASLRETTRHRPTSGCEQFSRY
ncbi:hypothetical protein ANK1_2939 [plant metagenome]|uniref:Uncharacterized protein n=1 Tax=plant metagenome TaxID=1297885 RepID=A0A484QJK7_9ZZZZ